VAVSAQPTALIDRLVAGACDAPHTLLGPHEEAGGWRLRVLRPDAARVTVVTGASRMELQRTHPDGVFEGWVASYPSRYRLELLVGGSVRRVEDGYACSPTLGPLDLHLIGEGSHERVWDRLGARLVTHDGVSGVAFAVWAPHARAVSVIGEFNSWDFRTNPMRRLDSGVFELLVAGVEAGAAYRFSILDAHGQRRERVDPLARCVVGDVGDTSIVHVSNYTWGDADWLRRRSSRQRHDAPISIYELHPGSWRADLGFRGLADLLPAYLGDLGFTHAELTPVMHHPFGGSWGYQVTGYFAPCARWGSPDDLKRLIDRLHQAGIGVILDWVPAHFPRDGFALAGFDGTALYEHPDPRRGSHPDWGTLIFDYGRPEVRNFLIASASYWLEEYHADGLRVDAVASMLYLDYSRPAGAWAPNEHGGRENLDAVAFLREFNTRVYRAHPDVCTIAEESTAWAGVSRPVDAGGLGFGFKWNMGWMHDGLRYIGRDAIHRHFHHNDLTFALLYAFSEHFVLAISHDEVVHAKGSLVDRVPGDIWQRLATIRAFLAYMWTHPGKKLVFMGCELGQIGDWRPDGELPWQLLDAPAHRGVRDLVRDLNGIYRAHPSLWRGDHDPSSFVWLEPDDAAANTYAYARSVNAATTVAVVTNFSPVIRERYVVAVPHAGPWREILNTDAVVYGGSGVGNLGAVQAVAEPYHGFPATLRLVLPPLGALVLAFDHATTGAPTPASADR
jgi:1,4-alpha-glucan branching enzyme